MSRKLFKSTSIVAGMTMVSRIMGFVRDMVLAQIFGAGAAFDAFVVAFKIPNFMRRLFGEGAFSQAFVPILAEYRAKKSHAEVQQFVNYVAGMLGSVVFIIVLIAEVFAPYIVMIFAPGFLHDPVRYHLATHMVHIIFPYLLLITLTAFMAAILNTYGKFAVAAFAPVLLNVVLVLIAWFWAPYSAEPIYTLAWGVIIGGVAQLALQIPFLKKINLYPKFHFTWKDSGVLRVMKLMVPALFGVSVAQISLLIDNIFASFLPKGSISWLYYSDRLTYLPLGVIGVALATVVMPYLSRHHSTNSPKEFSATLDWALRCALVIGIPAAVGLFVLAGPLLATLIHHGAFASRDVIMTERSLMAFAVGLPGFMLVKILASAFYSKQNIRTPVKIAVIAMATNLIMNVIFIFPLQHAGLALSTSLASLINCGLLLRLLLQKDIYQPLPQWFIFMGRIIFSNLLMGLLLWWLSGRIDLWLESSVISNVLHLSFVIFLAIIFYVGALVVSGLRVRHFYPPSH